jgi:GNAT superfamily N-acetyltransferase
VADTPPSRIDIRIDPHPDEPAFRALQRDVWGGGDDPADLAAILSRSLAHLWAYDGARLVGFVNVAWDGAKHASIFDTSVHPDWRRRGIGTALVDAAVKIARERGATWLHVDYQPHLTDFYVGCGFNPTAAGLIRLDAPLASSA